MNIECILLYKGDGLRLASCAYYSWEMTLNFDHEVSFSNMYDWRECGRQERKLTVKIFVIMRISVKFSTDVNTDFI